MALEPMTLRRLRLWHWRKVLAHRDLARAHEQHAVLWEEQNPGKKNRYARGRARHYDKTANFHLGAVQALNDVVDGTAEQDANP